MLVFPHKHIYSTLSYFYSTTICHFVPHVFLHLLKTMQKVYIARVIIEHTFDNFMLLFERTLYLFDKIGIVLKSGRKVGKLKKAFMKCVHIHFIKAFL